MRVRTSQLLNTQFSGGNVDFQNVGQFWQTTSNNIPKSGFVYQQVKVKVRGLGAHASQVFDKTEAWVWPQRSKNEGPRKCSCHAHEGLAQCLAQASAFSAWHCHAPSCWAQPSNVKCETWATHARELLEHCTFFINLVAALPTFVVSVASSRPKSQSDM